MDKLIAAANSRRRRRRKSLNPSKATIIFEQYILPKVADPPAVIFVSIAFLIIKQQI